MRIMAIDYGDQRIVLAVSDALGILVGDAWTLKEWKMERAAKTIAQECKTRGVGLLVLGLPKNMDGTEGVRAELCREFADKLKEATGLPVTMWDERRTTVEAHNILSQHNYHGKKRKNTVDAVAASLILEGYLAFRKR